VKELNIFGAIPALITPFTEEGNIMEDALKELIDFHLEGGLDAFYICGSTGEGMIMDPERRMHIAEIVVNYVAGRVPVIVHVGTADTETAIALARHADKIGADCISSVPPYYYKMSREYIKEYYAAVASSTQLPFLVYNIPMLTGFSISSEFMIEMANIKNVIGLKFTDTNLEEFRAIKAYENGRIKAFMGYDAIFLSALVMGADGGIGSYYNIMPRAFADVYDSFIEGKHEQAKEIMWQIARYILIVKKYLNPANQPALKVILKEIGINCGTTKAPILPLKESVKNDLLDDLRRNGFFEFIK
jgi:N-acetylneuraminate lyase